MQKTKLDELLEFPCQFSLQIIGKNDPNLAKQVLEIIKKYAPGTYSPQEKVSGKNSYRSVSITIKAKDIKQVETLYKELAKIDGVKMVL